MYGALGWMMLGLIGMGVGGLIRPSIYKTESRLKVLGVFSTALLVLIFVASAVKRNAEEKPADGEFDVPAIAEWASEKIGIKSWERGEGYMTGSESEVTVKLHPRRLAITTTIHKGDVEAAKRGQRVCVLLASVLEPAEQNMEIMGKLVLEASKHPETMQSHRIGKHKMKANWWPAMGSLQCIVTG